MVATRLRICQPDETARLLPGALAGDYVLAPVAELSTARLLSPDVPVTEAGAAVVLTTSGSTGSPKAVVLSSSAITSAAKGFRERYGSFTWTCVLPTHYVAGLMVVARGLLDEQFLGSGVRTGNPDLADLRPGPGPNAISMVPTQLVRALRSARLTASLGRYDLVLVGGSATPSDVRTRARDAGISVLTSYGMSETCGGCVVESVPLPGVDVALGQDGRISIGGPMVFSGYRGDPRATAETLVDGRVLTHDRGEWTLDDGIRRLRVLGRCDDVVITGGVNVDLGELHQQVDALAAGESAVLAVPDEEWGARIVSAITKGSPDLAWWREALRSRCAPAALPRQLLVLDALPRTRSGKVDRLRLRELAASRLEP